MKCPGQDPRYWKFDAIFETKCPHCGSSIEFFKDETRRKCKKCGNKVLNPKMDFGCAAHCKFAEQCFGEMPPELIKEKENLFKDRVAVEAKFALKQNFKLIARAAKVARYADKMVAAEQCDPAVVLSAAYLHEVDSAQDANEPSQVKAILEKLGAAESLIEEVNGLIHAVRSGEAADSSNYKVFHDARRIVILEEEQKKSPLSEQALEQAISDQFLTESGADLARSILLNTEEEKKAAAQG